MCLTLFLLKHTFFKIRKGKLKIVVVYTKHIYCSVYLYLLHFSNILDLYFLYINVMNTSSRELFWQPFQELSFSGYESRIWLFLYFIRSFFYFFIIEECLIILGIYASFTIILKLLDFLNLSIISFSRFFSFFKLKIYFRLLSFSVDYSNAHQKNHEIIQYRTKKISYKNCGHPKVTVSKPGFYTNSSDILKRNNIFICLTYWVL